MSFCRICRTENNLKYSLKQLRRINKRLVNNTKDLLYAAPVTQTGNICFDCEQRLLNFNKHIESDEEIDDGSVTVREDSPVIVDDDELLYNLFFNKKEVKVFDKTSISDSPCREFTQHSLGSDGDAEIIEVLNSSRESTPLQSFTNESNVSSYEDKTKQTANIIHTETIDLERGEKKDYSDEKIIFHETRKIQRKRKRLADCDVKLVATLNLISSDSETETEQPLAPTSTDLKQPQMYTCDVCQKKFLNLSALQSHRLAHKSVYCPVCNASYALGRGLVHHMREKHRSYSGDVLKERQKCSQDSAMTIRLRYLQRDTYYECQLCGQIDSVFKQHKHHIITKHPAESKSLKDPMMKELACPICKAMCGSQYLKLCTHLRLAHRDNHEPHLKEVSHTLPFGWSSERQKEVEATSRIFQFSTRRSRYFECKSCNVLFPGYFNHWKHLNTNGTCAAIIGKQTNNHKELPATRKDLTKNKKNVDATKNSDIKKEQPMLIPSKGKTQRPKDHAENFTASCAVKTGIIRKQSVKKIANKTLKTTTVGKPKVRLVNFPTLEYNCKYCSKTFKGFLTQNIHVIKEHSLDEYGEWKKCMEANVKSKSQEMQSVQKQLRPQVKTTSKIKEEETLSVDENSNTTYNQQHHFPFLATSGTNVENEGKWLQGLMPFSMSQNASGKTEIQQCEYCTQLFSDYNAFLIHEQAHIEKRDIKVVKCIR